MTETARTRVIPSFGSDAEKAQWWFENQDRFGRDLSTAQADGSRGTVARRAQLRRDGVVRAEQDILAARTMAERRECPAMPCCESSSTRLSSAI
jgi:hypothetical protein